MTTPNPTPETEIRERADRLMAKCRRRQSASLADVEQLKNDVHDLAAELDRERARVAELYRQTDYWRESYRIVKGLTDEELNAQVAIEEATAPHPTPCHWPSSPYCTCGTEGGDR